MGAPKLRAFVHLTNPETQEVQAFGPADSLPRWAIGAITNPKAWAVAPGTETVEAPPAPAAGTGQASTAPVIPPESGAGSSRDAWAAYATTLGADVDPKATREQILAALTDAGHPTE